jgi:hypothetical protein
MSAISERVPKGLAGHRGPGEVIEMGLATPQEPTLISHARRLANGWNQALDTLHIWYVALTNPEVAGNAADVIRYVPEPYRERMLGAVLYILRTNPEPAYYVGAVGPGGPGLGPPGRGGAGPGGPGLGAPGLGASSFPTGGTSYRYYTCESSWKQVTFNGYGATATNALVLATVLQDDALSGPLLAFLAPNLDVAGIIQRLRERAVQVRDATDSVLTAPVSLSVPVVASVASGTPAGDEAARRMAMHLVREIRPTHTYQDAHTVVANFLMDKLADSAPSREIPVAVGPNGSLIQDIPMVLADRMAGERFVGAREVLNAFRGVYQINLVEVCGLSPAHGEPPPNRVLEQAIQIVAHERRGTLIVDHVERLNGAGDVEASVRTALLGRADALVVGLYRGAVDEGEMYEAARRGVANALVVTVDRYDDRTTMAFIDAFYRPRWAARGFAIETDATFNLLWALEPGIWIDLERKTLPYVVIDIAEAALQTARRDEDIKETAQAAIAHLDFVVRNELPHVRPEIRQQFDPLLHRCRNEITHLIGQPSPRRLNNGQLHALRGAHLIAQLFAPNESRFHIPPNKPKAAPRTTTPNLAPAGSIVPPRL